MMIFLLFTLIDLACSTLTGYAWAGRADSIVKDAERVRRALVPADSCGGKMAILGQSFGGFCCLTYLSQAPEGTYIRPSLSTHRSKG